MAFAPNPKPEPWKRVKARRKRQEATVKKSVREQVDERDGYCVMAFLSSCEGPSEWAHIGRQRRCHTRGMAPERRHTTAGSCKMCQKHHRAYDAHAFDVRPVDAALGMNGQFKTVLGKRTAA